MNVKRVDIWHLNLAFLSPIKHHLATHEGSENLVVKVTTDQALTGYGEGVPRAFVTGETLAGSLAFAGEVLAPAALGLKLSAPEGLLDVLAGCHRDLHAAPYPAAFCAWETALLDAASRTWARPVSDFIGPSRRDRIIYSAVIPLVSEPQMIQLFKLVKLNRMQFVKLKVGTDYDLRTLKLCREHLGWDVDLRVDANSAWSAPEAIERLQAMAPYRLSAVEQPVPKNDFAGLAEVSRALPLPVIADESLCTLEDARRLIDLKACRIFNLRLSKCGGLGNAARLMRLAGEAGILCQVGCHVGETSILSAAGRHFAGCVPDLAYAEGSFSPFLLAKDPVRQPLVFGSGGVGRELNGAGLGIEVLDAVLDELAVSRHVLES